MSPHLEKNEESRKKTHLHYLEIHPENEIYAHIQGMKYIKAYIQKKDNLQYQEIYQKNEV